MTKEQWRSNQESLNKSVYYVGVQFQGYVKETLASYILVDKLEDATHYSSEEDVICTNPFSTPLMITEFIKITG